MKFENTEVWGFEHSLRGMRNPKNSWNKSDSEYWLPNMYIDEDVCGEDVSWTPYHIGQNDMKLAQTLIKGGNEHRKFLRQIFVSVDITAPLYWWKEFDTYKVGTTANSCSTMHKIAAKEFTLDDFSHEHLDIRTRALLDEIIKTLNDYRKLYMDYNADAFEIKGCPSKKDIWWQMIQLLPSSYNQKRTVTMTYENLLNMYFQRRNHKLTEWAESFIEWVKILPYAEKLIMYEE